MGPNLLVAVAVPALLCAAPLCAQEPATRLAGLDVDGAKHEAKAGDTLGLEFTTADKRFSINGWLRTQFRYSDPFDDDPRNQSEFEDMPGSEFELRRARLKIEGHLFNPRIGYYFEHELTGDHPLLELRLDFELRRDVRVRLGQSKVLYNRERLDSSGQQQFVERSIANYAFTLDRQIGATLAKHWAQGTRADNWLMLGAFEGDGIDPGARGDDPMLAGRWQWQFLGEPLPFSQSDLKFRTTPAASLAVGAARVRGPYTRFSSSGGGQLDGFAQGSDDRYTLEQWLLEFAWHYAGFSLQQELHVKDIDDHDENVESRLVGGYVQFGKAWRARWEDHPFIWELAARYGRVDWQTPFPARVQDEMTLAATLFFSGHDNKLSVDVSRIGLDQQSFPDQHDVRLRLQWDVSF